MFDCSDHFALLIKIKVRDSWIFYKVEKGVRKRLRTEKFREEGIREEYRNEVAEALESQWETKMWKRCLKQ